MCMSEHESLGGFPADPAFLSSPLLTVMVVDATETHTVT